MSASSSAQSPVVDYVQFEFKNDDGGQIIAWETNLKPFSDVLHAAYHGNASEVPGDADGSHISCLTAKAEREGTWDFKIDNAFVEEAEIACDDLSCAQSTVEKELHMCRAIIVAQQRTEVEAVCIH